MATDDLLNVSIDSHGFLHPQSVSDRLTAANRFLELGKREIQESRARADKIREREAAEKVFHSFLEACAARIQKYGVGVPENHEQIRYWLRSKRDETLLKLFEDAYLGLHVKAYYRGWSSTKEIDSLVDRIGMAIERIGKEAKR